MHQPPQLPDCQSKNKQTEANGRRYVGLPLHECRARGPQRERCGLIHYEIERIRLPKQENEEERVSLR